MKKKLTALLVAAVMVMSSAAAFAQNISVKEEGNTKAIVLCYNDSGALVYSKLVKSAEGDFNMDIPSQYDSTKKKLYLIDTQEFKNLENFAPEPTSAPEPTATPVPTAVPTASPKVSGKDKLKDTPYEKEVDEIYSPALVTDIASGLNADNEEVYKLKAMYLGKEVDIEIDNDLTIRTAPEAYDYMEGQNAGALKKGDVVYLTANVSGDSIRSIDFITRPASEDIVTGDTDYGTSFEKLFTKNGKVAGEWNYLKYGVANSSSDKYEYAYGVIGQIKGNKLLLLNKSGVTEGALNISLNSNAYVYDCDVSGKEYSFSLGGISDITTDISQKELKKDVAEFSTDCAYNYAIVRMINGDASEIVIFSNYNN